jgi:hypothetical protein
LICKHSIYRTLEKLTGIYETYKGTMRVQVSARGGILVAEIKDRYVDTIIPLVPDKLEGDLKTFHAIQPAARLPVEFTVQGDKVDLIYERYRLKKTSGPAAKQ